MSSSNKKYEARDIANFFIKCGEEEQPIPIPMTPLKIQKMVYFAQGFYLALTGEPLITENFEAWQYGPVVNNLYWELKTLKANIIPFDFLTDTKQIDENTNIFLRKIWDLFKDFTGIELSNISHDPKGPWAEMYKKEPKSIIPNELMKKYFTNF